MGICLTAKKSNYAFYMGAGGFFNLRKRIAYVMDKEFGEHYESLLYCYSKRDFEYHDRITNRMIKEKALDMDIVSFLYMSDCGGNVSHKVCKKIYDLIKDVDLKHYGFRYGAYQHHDYEQLKEFLLECYTNRRKMRWS